MLRQYRIPIVFFMLSIISTTSLAQGITFNSPRNTAFCITSGTAWPSRKPDWINGPVGLVGFSIEFPRSEYVTVPFQVLFIPWSFFQQAPDTYYLSHEFYSSPFYPTYPVIRHEDRMESGYSLELKGGVLRQFIFPAGQKAKFGILFGVRGQLEKWRLETYIIPSSHYGLSYPPPEIISYGKRDEFRTLLELYLWLLPLPENPNFLVGVSYALSAFVLGDDFTHPISLDGFRLMVNIPILLSRGIEQHHTRINPYKD